MSIDGPHTMPNCFADEQPCDNCGTMFRGRTEIWVWCEHTCCSRACVIHAKKDGDAEVSLSFKERAAEAANRTGQAR